MTISDTDFADLQRAIVDWPYLKAATNGLVLPLPLVHEEIGDETKHNFTAAFLQISRSVFVPM